MSTQASRVPALARAAARLSDPAGRVHRAVLIAFAATGQPPPQAEIQRLIRADGGEPDRVRAELTDADLLAFAANGEIRAAYPFSPTPTPIRVSWSGGPDAYAMCAIDALGMSAMLGRPVTVTAAEPGTGRVITVTVNGDSARWKPRTAVVFAGGVSGAGPPAADRCCGYINFFTTMRAARAWAGHHPEISGDILRRRGALRIGIDQFGPLLQTGHGDTSEPRP